MVGLEKGLNDSQRLMMPSRRERQRRVASREENRSCKRRLTISVNMIVACSLLWVMTIHRAFLWHVSDQRHNITLLEMFDFGKLSVGSSLDTFGVSRYNDATNLSILERSADDSLASMNLPIWMKGIFNILLAYISSQSWQSSHLCFSVRHRVFWMAQDSAKDSKRNKLETASISCFGMRQRRLGMWWGSRSLKALASCLGRGSKD